MNNRRCPECGFLNDYRTCNTICLCCGWNYSSGYEELKLTDNKGYTTTIVKFQSEKDVYYEYTPNTTPFYEDAWGKYYLGKCYSKRDSCFLKNVTVCLINPVYYVSSLWQHIKEKPIDFTGTSFIPIIDYISCSPNHHYLIEEHYDGVSLYDLMRGKVCGADNQPIGFVIMMFEIYQHRKNDFAKMVVMEILKVINSIHENDIAISFIELPENILFTSSGEIRIRIRGSLLSVCKLPFTIFPDEFDTLFPVEYASPERIDERIELEDNRQSSEVYAVGILLYSMLTAHLPYIGYTSLAKCHEAHEPYIDPRDEEYKEKPHVELLLRDYDKDFLNEISEEYLRIIIKKAIKMNPMKRYQSAREFIFALNNNGKIQIPWYKKVYSFFRIKEKKLSRILYTTLFAFFFCVNCDAQSTMRINYKDGSVLDTPIECIDSITFFEKTEVFHEATLIGEWFWGNNEKGYFEVLTFNDDRTYVGYDYYLEYGFDTMTYGTYMNNGIILNLWSSGYGYRRIYRWFVTGLTENAFEVITQMGDFVYYRVQPEVYCLKVGEESYACIGEDYYVFTDGVKVQKNERKLKGICEGTTYVLKYYAESGLIMAYKVVVKK